MKDKLAELIASQIAADEALRDLCAAITRYTEASKKTAMVTQEFGDLLKNLDIPYIDALEAEDNG